MYKNVSLRKRSINGQLTWMLLGPAGKPISAFEAFAKTLRKEPQNTVNSYCRHLAQFFDYLIEASTLFGQNRPLTKLELTETLEAYGDYLRMGIDAANPIASAVAMQIPPGVNSRSSLGPKQSAVRRFLGLSEVLRKELAELALLCGDSTSHVDLEKLWPQLDQRRKLLPYEIQALQANSCFAGVIAGGPKFINSIVLADKGDPIPYEESRAFPYDKVMDLIDAAPSYLDKTQYALLAASGCRTHEGLQLLIEDIDAIEGTVQLVAPSSRSSHQSYRALSSVERPFLSWKGRTTTNTLLIEPFASAFFQSLQCYLEREYIPHGHHDFIFQYRTGEKRGKPYFLSAASTRLEKFRKTCRHIGVTLPHGIGPHSLRHMYGTYLLNYFPRANGDYGLPVPMVQQLMGHSEVKSTLKYAKYDKDLLKLEIKNANKVLFKGESSKNLIELKLLALESQVEKLKKQMINKLISHD